MKLVYWDDFEGIKPDPRNSLLAMIDSSLRKKVIKVNNENHNLKTAHVSGKDMISGLTPQQDLQKNSNKH